MEKSGNQQYTITENPRQLPNEFGFTGGQVLGINKAPVALIKFKRFFGGDWTCSVPVPREQFQLGEISGNNRGYKSCSHHALNIVHNEPDL